MTSGDKNKAKLATSPWSAASYQEDATVSSRKTRFKLSRQESLPDMTVDGDVDVPSDDVATAKRTGSPQYVSCGEDDDGVVLLHSRSGSPMRCVSEFDEVLKDEGSDDEQTEERTIKDDELSTPLALKNVPSQPNPLLNEKLRSNHIAALGCWAGTF